MNKNLSELLAEARGAPIKYGDLEVQAIYEVVVAERSVWTVTFERVSTDRPQGLHLKTERATLVANDVALTDAIFWSDTAPRQFDISVAPTRNTGLLKIWNEWRDDRNVEHAWIGNAGMVVRHVDDDLLFKCSDGIGEPMFDDLVVRVSMKRNVVDFTAARRKRTT